MKFIPETKKEQLHLEIKEYLNCYREKRQFNTKQYIKEKAQLLNQYYRYCGLKSAVVAVSGGIDSAVVLAIACEAKKQPNSPIEQIIAITLPVDTEGATNQPESVEKAQELCQTLDCFFYMLDVFPIFKEIYQKTEEVFKQKGQPWAKGQLVAYARTPCLYYITSLLSEQDKPGVILGTNNKDEGAYLGYFGKASDGMVDIQMISDIHKSEVYQIAQYLKVPNSIIEANPTGDMYDARIDEEVFGAPYDFVELYLHYLESQKKGINLENHNAKEQFNQMASNLEALHQYNKHKYWVGSPAIHLDLPQYQYKINNGWRYNTWK